MEGVRYLDVEWPRPACCWPGNPGASCCCSAEMRALRGWGRRRELMPPMTAAQREYCYFELAAIGLFSTGHVIMTDRDLANEVINGQIETAWADR